MLIHKRATLETRRDRLALASTALSRIQIQDRTPGQGRDYSQPSGTSNSNLASDALSPSGSSSSSSSSSSGGAIGRKEKTRLMVTVAIGANGIGLIVTDDESSNHIIIKDLRRMPDNAVNPSEQAGIKVGDEVEKINGEAPGNLQDAVNALKNCKHSVTLTILRS